MGNEISIDISGIKASSRNTWILRGFITFCAVLSRYLFRVQAWHRRNCGFARCTYRRLFVPVFA